MFPHALLELLSMHNSDHNPLLLSCVKAKSKRVKSFHFQAAWMSHPDYAALVQHTWVSTIGNVHRKLDYIRKKSTKFNERVLGDIFKRNCQIEARIKGVHKQLDTFPYSHFIILEKQLQVQYDQVLHEEEMLWYQKSREQWIKFGNKNTKFFLT